MDGTGRNERPYIPGQKPRTRDSGIESGAVIRECDQAGSRWLADSALNPAWLDWQ